MNYFKPVYTLTLDLQLGFEAAISAFGLVMDGILALRLWNNRLFHLLDSLQPFIVFISWPSYLASLTCTWG